MTTTTITRGDVTVEFDRADLTSPVWYRVDTGHDDQWQHAGLQAADLPLDDDAAFSAIASRIDTTAN